MPYGAARLISITRPRWGLHDRAACASDFSGFDQRRLAMNVCQQCGACCASLRVDFHPAELADGAYAWGAGVPVTMTLPLTPAMVRMKGTDDAVPRCVALLGEIGVAVNCAIYDGRPSPCREFSTEHDACRRARQRCGLPLLAD